MKDYNQTISNKKGHQHFTLPVLLFHSITEGKTEPFNVTPQEFKKYIHFIAYRFKPISLEEAIQKIKKGLKPNHKELLITFDDAYQNNYLNARLVLLEFNIPAVFFILPNMLGQKNLWNTKTGIVHPHLTLKELAKVKKDGFEIGSHGLTHHNLVKFEREEIKEELLKSKFKLEEILEQSITSFAYPYGSYNRIVVEETSKIYNLAFATDNSPANWQANNLYTIRREYVWPNMREKKLYQKIVNYKNYV